MTLHDVFISYSTRDNGEARDGFVTRVKDALEAAGLGVWLDATDMQTSMKWWQQIEENIERANNFVFIISPNSLNSEWCHKEIAHARKHGKHMIAFVYQPVEKKTVLTGWLDMPFETLARENLNALLEIEWLDEYPTLGAFDAAVAKLIEDIKTDTGCVADHTQLVLQTTFWLDHGRTPSACLRDDVLERAERLLESCGGKVTFVAEQRAFIAESRRILDAEARNAARMRRLIRWLIRSSLVFAIAAVIAFGATGYAFQQLDAAARQTAIAERRTAEAEFLQSVTDARNTHVTGSNSYFIGNFEGAARQYRQSLDALNPNALPWDTFTAPEYANAGVDISAWLNDLGKACGQVRDYDCAADALADAILTNAGNHDAYLNLASVYREQGDVVSARDTLRKIRNPTREATATIDWIAGSIEVADGNYYEALAQLRPLREQFAPQPGERGAGVVSAVYLDILYYMARSYEGLNEDACAVWDDYQATRLRVPPSIPLLWSAEKHAAADDAYAACHPVPTD